MPLTAQSVTAALAANAIRVRRLQVSFTHWTDGEIPVWNTQEVDLRHVVGELCRRLQLGPDRLWVTPHGPAGALRLWCFPPAADLPHVAAYLRGDISKEAFNAALRASAALIANVQAGAAA